MIVNATNTQMLFQQDFSEAYHAIHLVQALQVELAALQAKVEVYYHNDIVVRGDKTLMREYRGHFGMEA